MAPCEEFVGALIYLGEQPEPGSCPNPGRIIVGVHPGDPRSETRTLLGKLDQTREAIDLYELPEGNYFRLGFEDEAWGSLTVTAAPR